MVSKENLNSIIYTLANHNRPGSDTRVYIDTIKCQDGDALWDLERRSETWLDFRVSAQLHDSHICSQQMMELGALMLFLATQDSPLDVESIDEMLIGYGFPPDRVARFTDNIRKML